MSHFVHFTRLLNQHYKQNDITLMDLLVAGNQLLNCGPTTVENIASQVSPGVIKRFIELANDNAYVTIHSQILMIVIGFLNLNRLINKTDRYIDSENKLIEALLRHLIPTDENEEHVSNLTSALTGFFQTQSISIPTAVINLLLLNFNHYSQINSNSNITKQTMIALNTYFFTSNTEYVDMGRLTAFSNRLSACHFNEPLLEANKQTLLSKITLLRTTPELGRTFGIFNHPITKEEALQSGVTAGGPREINQDSTSTNGVR